MGILKLSNEIEILLLKLFLGHRRNNDITGFQIDINEMNAQFEHGYNREIISIDKNPKLSNKIWSDKITSHLI